MHLSSRGLCLSLAFSLERCGENGGGGLKGSEVDVIEKSTEEQTLTPHHPYAQSMYGQSQLHSQAP